jgi:choline dehydrogenase-like flavoprotein
VGPVEAFQICEQAPDPENRVQLSDETDAVGMRKGKVRFGWGRFDRFSAVRAQEIFGQELAASGVGVLGPRRRRGEPLVRQLSAHHPAGTTRMSDDPATGVVDSNGRVHNTSNLFVASSAVFPTAGFAPPTLTILAWAMRLADHLSTLLASEGLPPL